MIIALAITHDAGTIAPLNFWNFNGRSCHSLRFQVKRHLNTCVFRKCFPDLCEKRAGLRLDAVFFPSLYDANADREILHLARVVENPPSAYVLGQGKNPTPTHPTTHAFHRMLSTFAWLQARFSSHWLKPEGEGTQEMGSLNETAARTTQV